MTSSNNPARESYPSFYRRGDRHRNDVCRVYTHLIGGKEVGNELTLRVGRAHTVDGLQYQELRMRLRAEAGQGWELRDFPGAAWV